MINIYDYFSKVSSNKVAIIYKDKDVTFGNLKTEVEKLAFTLLKEGCSENSIICLLLEETIELIVPFLAVAKLNSKFFPINVKYPTTTVEQLVLKLKPQIIITNPLLTPKLGKIINLIKSTINFSTSIEILKLPFNGASIDEDTFAILFTSGTTALPKGVKHKQQDFIFVGERCFSIWNIKENEKLLSLIPLFSAATLGCILVPAICYGNTILLPEKRKPYYITKLLQNEKKCFIIGTPTSFIELKNYLINNKEDTSFQPVRGTVAGAPVPEGFVEEINETLGIKLYPHYGMTELLAVTSTYEGGDFNTVGKQLKDIEVALSEDGEVIIKTPAMTTGYIDNIPLPLDKNGFFYTNDVGFDKKNCHY